MKIGQKITFDIHTWLNNKILVMKEVTSVIQDFIHDPLKRHESKCLVVFEDIKMGIPFSEIKKYIHQKESSFNCFNVL